MTITSLAPRSRCAIRPSGETLDLVRPGISRVVARTRPGVGGVTDAEICGDDGAVDIGVSDNGIPTPSLDALRVSVGMTLEERPAEFLGGGISDDASVPVLLLLLLGL
jgi:hypothetical protein